MRMLHVFAWIALAAAIPAYSQSLLPGSAAAIPPEDLGVQRLTLDQALRLAERANPELRAAEAGTAAAEGRLQEARALLFHNPEVSTGLVRRRVPQAGFSERTLPEWNVGLAQTFEVAGQRGYRRDAARLDFAATRETIHDLRRQIRAEVELRFSRVLALQRRIDLERDALKLSEEAAAAVGKRVAAGEDSRLDGNLASVDAERSRNQITLSGERLIQARADLAALLQLPPGSLPQADGTLEAKPVPYSFESVLSSAADQPRLRALELREQAARNVLSLERASAYPDVTIALGTGQEGPGGSRERIAMLSVSVPLPLFNRNAAGIGRATSELTQIQIKRQAAVRDVQAQVRALWQRLDSLHGRLVRLSSSVVPRLDENQRLSAQSYRAGEIGLLQLLLVNRQLLDARRDYLDAVTEYVQTRIELERTAGLTGAAGAN